PLAALVVQIHSVASPVHIANLNARRQIAIAGSDHALQQVMALALEHGASKVQRLAVSVPSHCALFDAAALEMQAAFAPVSLRRPVLIYLSSSAARTLFEPARIRDSLATNMARQVNWADTVRLAWERGARLALEMPSGSVLTRLTAPERADGRAISCEGQRSDSLLARLAEARRTP
ncbi:MAG: malonate decarboxylase subunit epsilon, partial [Pseudomonadota bacterium]